MNAGLLYAYYMPGPIVIVYAHGGAQAQRDISGSAANRPGSLAAESGRLPRK